MVVVIRQLGVEEGIDSHKDLASQFLNELVIWVELSHDGDFVGIAS